MRLIANTLRLVADLLDPQRPESDPEPRPDPDPPPDEDEDPPATLGKPVGVS